MSIDFAHVLESSQALTLGEAPEGLDTLFLADLARGKFGKEGEGTILHIARDDARAAALTEALSFFASDVEIVQFPAWDCLPYDRVSPKGDISSARMAALHRLCLSANGPRIVLTTVNAALQRVVPRAVVESTSYSAHVGNEIDLEALTDYLNLNGYARVGTVLEPGDYAIRGGIIDVYPAGQDAPVRLDLFGDVLESVRTFDPETQRSATQQSSFALLPVNEVLIDKLSIQRFRQGYIKEFGAAKPDDVLYESISSGRKHPGMEHWLPLFYEELATLFDFVSDAMVTLDPLTDDAIENRLSQITDYFDARADIPSEGAKSTSFSAPVYNPLPPRSLYLDQEEIAKRFSSLKTRRFSPFSEPETSQSVNLGGRAGRNFAPERNQEKVNVYEALIGHVKALQGQGKRVILANWTKGSRDRMESVLKEHGLNQTQSVDSWKDAQSISKGQLGLAILGLDAGFETHDLAVVSEQDVLGDRLIRSRSKSRRAADFIKEASSLTPGDLVVHVDHGIGRYEGLKTIEVTGAPHDCLQIIYAGGDKLFLPVENIELLSRFGSDHEMAQLDRLGGSGWQARKAKLKERIRDMADQLIKIAAERELREAEKILPPEGLYEEFCARFPFEETEDQLNAIHDVIDDLSRGRPMDRLICGDVGFGKTEVALRAAFVAVMAGHQVAVVCPTTLLCRQHYRTFMERFSGLPVRIEHLSRLVSAKDATSAKKAAAEGDADIVIGTHALLAKSMKFKRLGLLIVDEEQHFGVAHKERLKELKSNVHVLTLTATPIPRTLQMALSGVRELSLIATPPIDRLAVRTYVSPFDPVVIREALLREHYRGGQSFFVCPRIADLGETEEFLKEFVPEIKVAAAHGQMPTSELEDIMNAFYDGKFDVLLSTTIVESGLDVPTANTLIVHRADMFGLSQLYQIRGRIGRSKLRAYAYLTIPPKKRITDNAEKRLQVLQSLDTLGAGFSIASHDLDIRGAGNLLGEEQSGEIKEVGLELYQEMLEEAVASLKSGDKSIELDDQWSPQINIGTSVLIPEGYVQDLNVRLALYRRLSELDSKDEIDGFGAELIDRFGELPEEVEHLLKIVEIKTNCRKANVEKVDAGPKGAVITFHKSEFPNPEGLINFISTYPARVKVRPDQKVVYTQRWDLPEDRLKGTGSLMRDLVKIAEAV